MILFIHKLIITNLITQTYAFGEGGMEVKAKAKLAWDMTNVRFYKDAFKRYQKIIMNSFMQEESGSFFIKIFQKFVRKI